MKNLIQVIFLPILCMSCSNSTPTSQNSQLPAFNPQQANYINKTGSILVQGEAFIIGKNGKPIFAAGETIRLVPATNYATARFNRLYKGKTFIRASEIAPIKPDPQYAQLTRTTISSARGKFEFDRVAAGKYFITAQKIIRTPGKFTVVGGAMFARVVITGKERWPVKVVVTGQ